MAAAFLTRFSLARRIALGLALLLILFALVTGVAIVGFVQTSRRMAALEVVNQQVRMQEEASREVIAIAEQAQRFASEGRPSSVSRVELHHERLVRYLEEMRATTPSPEMARVYLEMDEHAASFDKTFHASIEERLRRTTLVEETLPKAEASLNEAFEELSGDPTIAVEELLACRLYFLAAQADAARYLQELDSRDVDSALVHLLALRQQLQALARRNGTATSGLTKAEVATDTYRAAMLGVVQATRGHLYLTNVVMAGEIAEFLHGSEQLRSAAIRAASLGNQEARASMTRTMIALIGTFLFVVFFAPLFSVLLSKSILAPISQITDTFRALSDNEVMPSIPGGDSSDEMGELARAAEKFRQKIQEARELVLKTETAEAANRAKSVFLANMSHELRTPLNAVLGFSTMLRADPSMSPEQHESLDIINTSGKHLLGLINDVLDVAKIESGRAALEITSFDLRAAMRDIAALMRQRAEAKGLQMVLELAADLPAGVRADEGKLRQVIINLVGNAIKFTSVGTVTLRLTAGSVAESRLVIEVEDTGRGIALADRERIFEPFVQLHQSDRTGTGLGLTIIRQHVELMGGVIDLQSTHGQGAKFRIEIPIELSAAPSDARVVVAHRTQAPGQPDYRVLIVEDEEVNATLLRQLMERAGFQVRVAESGLAGVDDFRSWRPHFIWMDWRMPVMDGIEATRHIRTLEGGRDVKIVAVSASVFKDEIGQMLAAGADDVLPKPIQFDQMYDCLTRHLGVRFIEEDRETSGAAVRDLPLRSDAIATLPQELRGELADALVSLDRVRIAGAIKSISAAAPDLGDTLARHADRMAYSVMLRAVQAATAPETKETI